MEQWLGNWGKVDEKKKPLKGENKLKYQLSTMDNRITPIGIEQINQGEKAIAIKSS